MVSNLTRKILGFEIVIERKLSALEDNAAGRADLFLLHKLAATNPWSMNKEFVKLDYFYPVLAILQKDCCRWIIY